MKYCLIVWEEVPEDTNFYLVPWAEYEKYKDIIDASHGELVNNSQIEAPLKLYYLITPPSSCGDPFCTGELAECLVDKKNPIDANIQMVIWSGFLL